MIFGDIYNAVWFSEMFQFLKNPGLLSRLAAQPVEAITGLNALIYIEIPGVCVYI